MKREPTTPFTLLLACAFAVASCSHPQESGSSKAALNVLLVCLDTVRADHLGCYGHARRDTTPFLDRLASDGTRYADASATACWTKPSVPSFMTGTYPMQHGVYEGNSRDGEGEASDVLPAAATTLAEVFKTHGWDTAAFVRNAQLRVGMGIEQGFDAYTDEAGDAREIRWRAQDWLDQRERDRPFFLYLHFLDAHWPYPVPDEYATKFASAQDVAPFQGKGSRALRDAVNAGDKSLTPAEREHLEALYDGCLRFIDDQLAELAAFLERRAEWRDTIVCVVADHGEEFGEHGKLGHGHGLYEGLLRVPWILRVPGRTARRVDTPVSLIDLFPTLLGAAGLPAGATHQGRDRWSDPDSDMPLLAEHKESAHYEQSLRSGARKFLRRVEGLASDAPSGAAPGEPRPRVGQRYDVDLHDPLGGPLRARKLEPSADDVSELPQIKGLIEEFDGQEFSLCGVRIALARTLSFSGEVQDEADGRARLVDGSMIKVSGAWSDGSFLAQKVKVYKDDAEPDFELCGNIEALEELAAGRFRARIAGQWIEFDPSARLKGLESHVGPTLARETLCDWLAAGSDSSPRARVQRFLFDLAADPDERAARAIDAGGIDLERALEERSRALAGERLFGASDRATLDAKALEDLRAIGYAGGG